MLKFPKFAFNSLLQFCHLRSSWGNSTILDFFSCLSFYFVMLASTSNVYKIVTHFYSELFADNRFFLCFQSYARTFSIQRKIQFIIILPYLTHIQTGLVESLNLLWNSFREIRNLSLQARSHLSVYLFNLVIFQHASKIQNKLEMKRLKVFRMNFDSWNVWKYLNWLSHMTSFSSRLNSQLSFFLCCAIWFR